MFHRYKNLIENLQFKNFIKNKLIVMTIQVMYALIVLLFYFKKVKKIFETENSRQNEKFGSHFV